MSDKREPMLSDERMYSYCQPGTEGAEKLAKDAAWRTRKVYEDLIDKGVLMVVKEVDIRDAHQHVLNCKEGMPDALDRYFLAYIQFCPGCGARIKQA